MGFFYFKENVLTNFRYITDTISYISQWKDLIKFNNPAIIITTLMFVCILLRILYKRCDGNKVTLGERSISTICNLDDIIQEIHYASSHCRIDSCLISRCISLLEMYPGACNIPMSVHNYTPFLRACWNGCYELIEYMIEIGANVHATTSNGEGAIYLATYNIVKNNKNDYSILTILINAGADINAARCDGYTGLYLAAARGHPGAVRWLLARGARPTMPGKPSARRVALFYGHKKTAKLLCEDNLDL